MKTQNIYLVFSIVGAILPYSFFIPFLMTNGFDIPLFISQLFANNISIFFGVDVILSAIVLIVFILHEKVQYYWVAIIGTLSIGVSFGLPFYLYLRAKNATQIF